MVSDVVMFCETPVTHLAPEGPTTTMHKLVRFQIARCRKRFLAVATFVRFVLEKKNLENAWRHVLGISFSF